MVQNDLEMAQKDSRRGEMGRKQRKMRKVNNEQGIMVTLEVNARVTDTFLRRVSAGMRCGDRHLKAVVPVSAPCAICSGYAIEGAVVSITFFPS